MTDLLAQQNVNYPPSIGAAVGTIQSGTGTLSGGTLTVTGVRLTSSSVIMLTSNTPAGSAGFLSAPLASRNTTTGQFVANSSNGSDTCTFDWLIVG
jgi:hypothetical protein